MKKIVLSTLAIILVLAGYAQSQQLRIIAIGAHPDDCDSKFGGAAAKFAEMGHAVKFLSLTNGDAGHQSEGGGALAKRRRAEAKEAGRRLGIEYDVLDNHDAELLPTLQVRHQVIRKIREWNADIVLGHRPNDYHPDHRNAGKVVQDAAYLVVVPNVTPDTPPLKKNPLFLYMQDHFQKPNPFSPDIVVAIDDTIEKKVDGMDAHVSQFYEWLAWVGGQLEEVPKEKVARREWLAKRVKARPISGEMRKSLEKWYGPEKAKKIKHAEAMEIAEYGLQPNNDEIRKLFPMLR
ncbi:PIG-L deacetylase family protein [Fulvivirgaceae bacterium BMA12]|uniref:PIG-L deacetylase family protein n=1 Tax=Agaribacillus aureus TaxID=3051825 RepID=A0ABT8L6Z5_9BACT|nr:PIG-L deacetylase family protein [Fulvivirgaceae bacterium BMA12]